MIISIVNQKGGVGKTTLAINLAAAFALDNRKTLLIDADPQGTASDWASIRNNNTLPFQVVQLARAVLHRDAKNFENSYEIIVIDGPPRSYDVTRSSVLASDIIIIPVQPSGADIWATKEVCVLVKEAAGFNETQKSAFLVSRKITGTSIGKDIKEVLGSFGMPVLSSATTQKVAYAEAMTAGKTIFEYENKKKIASKEILEIKNEVLSL